MNIKRLESEIAMLKLILTTLATAKQVTGSGTDTGSYFKNYLDDTIDRTATQISLLQNILCNSDEFKSRLHRDAS